MNAPSGGHLSKTEYIDRLANAFGVNFDTEKSFGPTIRFDSSGNPPYVSNPYGEYSFVLTFRDRLPKSMTIYGYIPNTTYYHTFGIDFRDGYTKDTILDIDEGANHAFRLFRSKYFTENTPGWTNHSWTTSLFKLPFYFGPIWARYSDRQLLDILLSGQVNILFDCRYSSSYGDPYYAYTRVSRIEFEYL